MTTKALRSLFQVLGHTALAFALFGLVVPPAALAGPVPAPISPAANLKSVDWPNFFSATYTDTNQTYEYFKQSDGSLFYRSSDSSQIGVVDQAVLDGANITRLVENGNSFDATFTVPDGLGGTLDYQIYGTVDSVTGTADTTLVTPSGQVRGLELYIPSQATGNTAPLKAVIIITITVSAGVIAAVGCVWHALVTDCAEDCAAACSAAGGSLKSSDEGWCGTCTCECYPPPQQCDDETSNKFGGPLEPQACEVYEAVAVPISALR